MKINKNITQKELGLIKGALRRVFSRSDLRRSALDKSKIPHHDATRPRVKVWIRCEECKSPYPAYKADVDHKNPVIPVDKSINEMTIQELVDNIWCNEDNLQVLCEMCHNTKTKEENRKRRENAKSKRITKTAKKRLSRTSARTSRKRSK